MTLKQYTTVDQLKSNDKYVFTYKLNENIDNSEYINRFITIIEVSLIIFYKNKSYENVRATKASNVNVKAHVYIFFECDTTVRLSIKRGQL